MKRWNNGSEASNASYHPVSNGNQGFGNMVNQSSLPRSSSDTLNSRKIYDIAELQKKLQAENDELREKLEEAELQIDMYEADQTMQNEEKEKAEKQRIIVETEWQFDQQLEEDRTFATRLLTEIWSDLVIPVYQNTSKQLLTSPQCSNSVESNIIFGLQSVLTTIQSQHTTLSPLIQYLINHIGSASGNLVLSVLNTIIVSCPTTRRDLLKSPVSLHSATIPIVQSNWSIDGTVMSSEAVTFDECDESTPCMLLELLGILEKCTKEWESNNISFVCSSMELVCSRIFCVNICYTVFTVFPQWRLFKGIYIATVGILRITVLRQLVLATLTVVEKMTVEDIILVLDPDITKVLLLKLFARIRIPNINKNKNNNIDEVCENITLISKSLHILERIVCILLYNSSNNQQLSLILRYTLKSENINNVLTLGICLYNIIYDYYYVPKFDISKENLDIIASILFNEIALIEILIRKTSILMILRQEKLFDEYKSCLEVIVIDNQIRLFCKSKLIASKILSYILNDD